MSPQIEENVGRVLSISISIPIDMWFQLYKERVPLAKQIPLADQQSKLNVSLSILVYTFKIYQTWLFVPI